MRAHTAARLGILACTWFLAGCAGAAATGPGWTFGPTTPVDSIAPGPRATPAASSAPAPQTVPTPGPVATEQPGHTIPPLPHLTLVSGNVHREAVSGCGATIEIGGYTAADSCGPSFQVLGVDYVVRVPEGGTLRFELPAGWHFVGWSLGWVTQIEAERWRGQEPDTFRTGQTSTATSGRTLVVVAPPAGDWSVRLDWRGARGDDRFGVPDYFRVIVGG